MHTLKLSLEHMQLIYYYYGAVRSQFCMQVINISVLLFATNPTTLNQLCWLVFNSTCGRKQLYRSIWKLGLLKIFISDRKLKMLFRVLVKNVREVESCDMITMKMNIN